MELPIFWVDTSPQIWMVCRIINEQRRRNCSRPFSCCSLRSRESSNASGLVAFNPEMRGFTAILGLVNTVIACATILDALLAIFFTAQIQMQQPFASQEMFGHGRCSRISGWSGLPQDQCSNICPECSCGFVSPSSNGGSGIHCLC